MIGWGKNKSESRVTTEFYNCAIEVMRGAEAMDEYIALPQQEAFDIEYWLMEEAKLKRMPPEKEFARQVIAVIGAGSGIGKEKAHPNEIHLKVISTPLISQCYYWMDFPSENELIANQHNQNVEEIRKDLGVNSLAYLSNEKLLESVP